MAKLLIYVGITVGSIVGAYVPVWLFGVDPLSLWSIFSSAIGALIGLWFGYKANQYFGE